MQDDVEEFGAAAVYLADSMLEKPYKPAIDNIKILYLVSITTSVYLLLKNMLFSQEAKLFLKTPE